MAQHHAIKIDAVAQPRLRQPAASPLEERGDLFATGQYLTDPPTLPELKNLQTSSSCRRSHGSASATTRNEHFDHATIYDDILPDGNDILRAIAAASHARAAIRSRRPRLSSVAADGSFCRQFVSLLEAAEAEPPPSLPPPPDADADASAAPLMTSGGGKAALAERFEHCASTAAAWLSGGGETDRVFGGASKSATAAPEPPPKPRRPMTAAKGTNATAWGGSDEFAEGWDRIFGKKK